MKKIILSAVAALLTLTQALATDIKKSTHVYQIITDGVSCDTLRLDIYSSGDTDTDRTKRPAVIFAFGGSFRSGQRDAAHYLPYFNFLADNGFVVASIDYRTGMKNYLPADGLDAFASSLAQSVTMAVTDLYSATAYLLKSSDELSIDQSRIIISGSSAGAITALQAEYLICARSPLPAAILPAGFNYAGAVTFAGAVMSQGKPEWISEPCPLMMFHGDADTIVPFGSLEIDGMGIYGSGFLSQQLTEKDVAHYSYTVMGASHEVATSPMTDNLYDILAFLKEFVDSHADRITSTRQYTPGAPDDYKTDFTVMDYLRANMPQ